MVQHNYDEIARLVSEVIESTMSQQQGSRKAPVAGGIGLDPAKDFPLSENKEDLINTPTGVNFKDITMDAVLKGNITSSDMRISAETLKMQAEIAEKMNRKQLADNFRRSAELTNVSDERILEIYDALRPYRSSKSELVAIADELESKYGATVTGALVREAADVYEKRNLLK